MSVEKTIDFEGFKAFVEEFAGETDRAAVILGAAKLDTLLYQLLGKVLVPYPSGQDDLLDGDSPLSTFSSRINAAYRLGLIDAQFCRALHLIRRIRNAFAHELSGSTLDSGPHRDRVKELVLPYKGLPFVQEFGKRYFKGKKPGPSADFGIILAIMIFRLDYASLVAVPIENNKAITIITEIMKKWGEPGEEIKSHEKSPTKLELPEKK